MRKGQVVEAVVASRSASSELAVPPGAVAEAYKLPELEAEWAWVPLLVHPAGCHSAQLGIH